MMDYFVLGTLVRSALNNWAYWST